MIVVCSFSKCRQLTISSRLLKSSREEHNSIVTIFQNTYPQQLQRVSQIPITTEFYYSWNRNIVPNSQE